MQEIAIPSAARVPSAPCVPARRDTAAVVVLASRISHLACTLRALCPGEPGHGYQLSPDP